MEQVSFKYNVSQKVFFIYRDYIKSGIIEKISIEIDKNSYGIEFHPLIKYLIKKEWYYEYQLWDDKKKLKKWMDNNFCCTKYIQPIGDTGYWVTSDDEGNLEEVEVKVLGIIDRVNNRHPWKHRKFVEIFYFENSKGIVRYIPYEEITITTDINEIKGNKYDLFHIYGERYYEDEPYNFINYDGIKF